MPTIETKIDKESENYKSNYDYHKGLSEDLNKRRATVRKMGTESRISKHKSRGKLTARERIEKLKDNGTKFLEFSEFAGYQVYDDDIPAAGIITCI